MGDKSPKNKQKKKSQVNNQDKKKTKSGAVSSVIQNPLSGSSDGKKRK
jgi:hypothetical protein